MIFGDLVHLPTDGTQDHSLSILRGRAKECETVEKLLVANVEYLVRQSFGVFMTNDRDQPKEGIGPIPDTVDAGRWQICIAHKAAEL